MDYNINTMGSEEDSMVFFNALQVAEIDQFRIKSYLTVLDLTRLIFIYKLSRLKSMGHFIRKCVLEAPIFVIDMNRFRNI